MIISNKSELSEIKHKLRLITSIHIASDLRSPEMKIFQDEFYSNEYNKDLIKLLLGDNDYEYSQRSVLVTFSYLFYIFNWMIHVDYKYFNISFAPADVVKDDLIAPNFVKMVVEFDCGDGAETTEFIFSDRHIVFVTNDNDGSNSSFSISTSNLNYKKHKIYRSLSLCLGIPKES